MLFDPRARCDVLGITVLNLLRLIGWLATLICLALLIRRILLAIVAVTI
jgi:hypothetical protein